MMSGNGTAKKKIATKATAASAIMMRFFSARLPTRTTACEHDREHRGLQPEEQRRDEADIAEGGVDVAQAMMAMMPGRMNSPPAMMPAGVRCISQPI